MNIEPIERHIEKSSSLLEELSSPKSLVYNPSNNSQIESKTSTYGMDTYDSDNDFQFDPKSFNDKNVDDYGPNESMSGKENFIIPEVAATVPITDDPTLPVSTLRVYIISTFLIILTSFCAQFYFFRFNSVTLDTTVHIVLAYPMGVLMQKIPFKFLNPGKFNRKEHALIIIICSNAVSFQYGIIQLVIQRLFLGPNQNPKVPDPEGVNIGYITSILFLITSNMLGFGIAGVFEKFLVYPARMWFPQNLVLTNILHTFHGSITKKITRLRLKVFVIVFTLAFIYEFLPQLFAPVLQSFSLLCLIAGGASGTIRDIFNLGIPFFTGQLGSMRGGGIFSLSLDWQAVSSLQPLVTPLWSQLNVIFSNLALS
jgi:OPT family oligopeptide transporter